MANDKVNDYEVKYLPYVRSYSHNEKTLSPVGGRPGERTNLKIFQSVLSYGKQNKDKGSLSEICWFQVYFSVMFFVPTNCMV